MPVLADQLALAAQQVERGLVLGLVELVRILDAERRVLLHQVHNDFERISFWRTPVTQCKSQGNACVPYHKWVSDYIA